jgi:hypothetical protein
MALVDWRCGNIPLGLVALTRAGARTSCASQTRRSLCLDHVSTDDASAFCGVTVRSSVASAVHRRHDERRSIHRVPWCGGSVSAAVRLRRSGDQFPRSVAAAVRLKSCSSGRFATAAVDQLPQCAAVNRLPPDAVRLPVTRGGDQFPHSAAATGGGSVAAAVRRGSVEECCSSGR